MLDVQTLAIAAAIFAAFICGKLGRRWRFGKTSRSADKGGQKRPSTFPRPVNLVRFPDSSDQLRVVMASTFQRRKLMSRNEARVFQQVEKAAREAGHGWRVMAQVSLGEILSSPDERAYSAINSKRVDILLISRTGEPLAAIEYQGTGHYLGSAAARDAVKREALRRAGVGFIEVKPEHGAEDVAREILRLADPPAVATG